MLKQLKCEDIPQLDDGRVGIAINQNLRKIAQDCLDRPGDQTARKLTVEFSFKPIAAENGALDGSDLQVNLGLKLPKQKTRALSLGIHGTGEFTHNVASPDDVNQRTLDEAQD